MNLFNVIIRESTKTVGCRNSLEWDLNPRPTDLQSAVLPTELSRVLMNFHSQIYLLILFKLIYIVFNNFKTSVKRPFFDEAFRFHFG